MYVAVCFFVLYQPQEQLGGMKQDMHLCIGKYSGDLTFLHFDGISFAQGGSFHVCNSLERLIEMYF